MISIYTYIYIYAYTIIYNKSIFKQKDYIWHWLYDAFESMILPTCSYIPTWTKPANVHVHIKKISLQILSSFNQLNPKAAVLIVPESKPFNPKKVDPQLLKQRMSNKEAWKHYLQKIRARNTIQIPK